MLNVNFILDANFLASYILSNYSSERFIDYAADKYKKDIVKFQDLAYEKSKDIYKAIDGRLPIYKFAIQNKTNSFNETGMIIDSYIV